MEELTWCGRVCTYDGLMKEKDHHEAFYGIWEAGAVGKIPIRFTGPIFLALESIWVEAAMLIGEYASFVPDAENTLTPSHWRALYVLASGE